MALLECGDNQLYSTVQTAVTAASDGSTVIAREAAGTGNAYPEAITVNNKRITLLGGIPRLGVQLTGAGGGAAPTVLVTGSGGITLVNFQISNVGSSATYDVEGNVAEDWFHRLWIRGRAGKSCLQAQFVTNVIMGDAAVGQYQSCTGQCIVIHSTAVNMTTSGFSGALASEFQACLAYNCAGAAFILGSSAYSAWNVSDGPTSPGPQSQIYLPLASIAFVNYGAGDYRLQQSTGAYVPGASPIDCDLYGYRRMRRSPRSRIVAGAHDPWPETSSFLSGASQIRSV